jgi:hypothetical protein
VVRCRPAGDGAGGAAGLPAAAGARPYYLNPLPGPGRAPAQGDAAKDLGGAEGRPMSTVQTTAVVG